MSDWSTPVPASAPQIDTVDGGPPVAGAAVPDLEEPAITGAETKPVKAPRGAPKWESDTRDRLRTAVKRYSKPLADLVARDANEGDTRLLVTDFLCDALGYDKYEDLTTEYQVKGEFADYGVRVDKQLVAFIEVKRCTTRLGEKHLRQVQSYAVNEGVEWVWLTNGQNWQVWHITGGLPIVMDLAMDVDLLADGPPQAKIDQLFYLTRESYRRHGRRRRTGGAGDPGSPCPRHVRCGVPGARPPRVPRRVRRDARLGAAAGSSTC